ncbi:oligosaccharide flippase family protein [Candidatus Woesebacteria bacterium]|nr:oligosaccharide flippase family protein [Candidatus Woesebacteria bacterium]
MSPRMHRILKGLGSIAVLRAFALSIAFARLLVLARLLTPADFGIFGAATLLLAITEICTETGVSVFLMQQTNAKALEYLSTLWAITSIRGIGISVIMLLLTPIVISFFSLEHSVFIFLIVACIPLLKGLQNPGFLLLQKNLEFKKQALVKGVSILFGSIAMVLVGVATHSALALALGLLAETVIETILTFTTVAERPKFSLEKKKILTVLHHGKWLTVVSITNYLFHNFDDWLVGATFGAQSLGLYQMAYKIGTLPITEGADILSQVLFPAFSQVSERLDLLKKAFWHITLFLSIGCSALILFAYFFTQQLVELILGEKWLQIIPLIQVLIVFGSLRAITGFNTTVLYVRSKQHQVGIITTVSMLGLIASIWPLTQHFGVMGAAYASIVGSIVATPLLYYYLYQALKK